MAINREKREDLMRDATAYARRLMIRASTVDEAIFVGLRRNGSWSVYFGEDPVYQFDAENRLRRVHFENQNFAAIDGKLYLLGRLQLGGRVEFERIYSADTERVLLGDCLKRLLELADSLQVSGIDVIEQYPVDELNLVSDVTELIRGAANDLRIASSSNA